MYVLTNIYVFAGSGLSSSLEYYGPGGAASSAEAASLGHVHGHGETLGREYFETTKRESLSICGVPGLGAVLYVALNDDWYSSRSAPLLTCWPTNVALFETCSASAYKNHAASRV